MVSRVAARSSASSGESACASARARRALSPSCGAGARRRSSSTDCQKTALSSATRRSTSSARPGVAALACAAPSTQLCSCASSASTCCVRARVSAASRGVCGGARRRQVGQRGAAGAHQHAAGIERDARRVAVLLAQPRGGALGQRHALHAGACGGDEPGVGMRRRADLAAGQQLIEMAQQRGALGRTHALGQRQLPIVGEVGAQRGGVEVLAGEQHQVGAQRFVGARGRLAGVLAQPRFEAGGDARQEGVFEQALVAVVGRGGEHAPAAQQVCGEVVAVIRRIEATAGQCVERRQQRDEVGVALRLCQRLVELRQLRRKRIDGARLLLVAAPGEAGRHHHGQRAGGQRAALDPAPLHAAARQAAGQPAFGKDDVAQQPRHEVRMAAAARARCGILRRAGEVQAAQHRPRAGACADHGVQPFERRAVELPPLRRKGVNVGVAPAAALAAEAFVHLLVQPRFERVHLGTPLRRAGAARQRRAPDLRAHLRIEVGEEFGKARQQIGLGDEHIDRHGNAQPRRDFVQALPQVGRVRGGALGRGLQQIVRTQRQQHTVDRAARPVPAQQIEKAEPGGAVGVAVAVLRRVAAGGVDQHGL